MKKANVLTRCASAALVAAIAQTSMAGGLRVDATSTTTLAPGMEGGIAGVTGVTQNFETGFVAGSGCNQNGWNGACGAGPPPVGFLITQFTPPDPRFGSFAATFGTTGNPVGLAVAIASPTATTPETGRVDYDLQISNTASNVLVETGPCAVTGCFINTRLQFTATGTIQALQLTPGNCTTGQFVDTTGTWTPGVPLRIGIEVNGTGVLNVFKDNVQIFTGTDISVSCAPTSAQGIARVVLIVDNTTAGSTVTLDNIGPAGGSPCLGNIVTTGASASRVDVDDLLAVIGQWGPCPAPPAACPANVVTTGTSATRVDVDDLLFVITHWGPCP